MKPYTVHPVYGRDPFSGMPTSKPEAWVVKDFQHVVVARCDKQHNAQLLCHLLNNHT